ncbi:hyaluronan-binding protein 2-like [Acanthochromis polyacanthus]|uniref:trypsin n=1 Tax=Acanthochromis polyacanthus TaxID=80966 RepID=A0A3Q1FP30_9TELE|nr:hyaluronan-binding protein 2-like [Acanthochromis polyacanthus]
MNLKLLFFCLFLAVLLIPAECKHGKHKHREHREHRGHRRHREHHTHGPHEKTKTQKFKDIIEDFFFQILDGAAQDDDEEDEDPSEWLYELQEPDGQCNPNPCQNNGLCKEKGKRKFKCDCPKPFKGKKCQKGPKHCKRGRCGRGECVLTSTPPYYECKCKQPFQPPDCRSVAVCEPSPCKNGGTCVRDENDFDCQCPPGFRGRFCHVGPDDCFEDDGESYRGNVSETDDGDECLYWNSHFILASGVDPFDSFEDEDGLGPHNFCRNPDGESMPWCFFRRGRRLLWDYCDVTECPEPTNVPPTDVVPPTLQPTSDEPAPTTIAPPPPVETTQSAKPSAIPTDIPTNIPTSAPTSIPSPNATDIPRDFLTCGKPQPKKAITRIYGGLKVPPGGIPWQVSLQVKPSGSSQPFRHTCGGVLIASCWVLTAAHCIEPNKDMQVTMGSLLENTYDPNAQVLQVEKAIRHEGYRETPSAVYNDIALLKLNGTNGVCANETQFVKTACLPDAQLPDGTECTISGWGATEQSNYGSNHLLEANVLLINQEKCSEPKVYGKVLDSSMFCAGYLQGGVDSCQGDSGGPLTCKQNDTHVVYGLVSWGDQCGKKNKPGVYTRVIQFVDWIKANMQAQGA